MLLICRCYFYTDVISIQMLLVDNLFYYTDVISIPILLVYRCYWYKYIISIIQMLLLYRYYLDTDVISLQMLLVYLLWCQWSVLRILNTWDIICNNLSKEFCEHSSSHDLPTVVYMKDKYFLSALLQLAPLPSAAEKSLLPAQNQQKQNSFDYFPPGFGQK